MKNIKKLINQDFYLIYYFSSHNQIKCFKCFKCFNLNTVSLKWIYYCSFMYNKLNVSIILQQHYQV